MSRLEEAAKECLMHLKSDFFRCPACDHQTNNAYADSDADAFAQALRSTDSQCVVVKELAQDVIDLVVAGRIATYDEPGNPSAQRNLDEALEAFADRVPWDDQPDDVEVSTASQTHFPPSAQGGMAKELKTLFYDGYSCGHDAAKAQQWGRPPPDAEGECVKALSSISLRSEAEVKAEGAREALEKAAQAAVDLDVYRSGIPTRRGERPALEHVAELPDWLREQVRSQSSEGEG